LYLFGGRDLSDNLITSIDVYNAASNTWSTLSSTWDAATSDAVAVAVGSKIYIIGGYDASYNALNTVFIMDTSVSNPVVTTSTLPSLGTGRGDACAATDGDSIYVFGGYSTNFCAPLDTLEVLPASATSASEWSLKATLHKPRGDSACGFAHKLFHAVGGEEKSAVTNCTKYSIPIQDVEAYHADTNTWQEEVPLPVVGYRFAYATFEDTFYVFGGQGVLQSNQYQVSDAVYSWFDPDLVSSAPHVPTPICCFLLSVLFLATWW